MLFLDLGTVALLAFITLLDGVRRIPAGALVLRQVGFGAWQVSDEGSDHDRWLLVSWWPPISHHVVAAGGEESLSVADLDARLSRVIRFRLSLIALSAVCLFSLVLGVPLASGTFGPIGFLIAVAVVLITSLITTTVATFAVASLGRNFLNALRSTRHLLSPFSTNRAWEIVLEQATLGAEPLMVVRRFLGRPFDAWVRSLAYDAIRGRMEAPALGAMMDLDQLQAIVKAPPDGRGKDEPFCPRCARTYRAHVTECSDCSVPLQW